MALNITKTYKGIELTYWRIRQYFFDDGANNTIRFVISPYKDDNARDDNVENYIQDMEKIISCDYIDFITKLNENINNKVVTPDIVKYTSYGFIKLNSYFTGATDI